MRGPEQNRITGVELTPSSARRLRAAPMSGLFSCRVYSRSSTCRLEAVLALPMTIAWELTQVPPSSPGTLSHPSHPLLSSVCFLQRSITAVLVPVVVAARGISESRRCPEREAANYPPRPRPLGRREIRDRLASAKRGLHSPSRL